MVYKRTHMCGELRSENIGEHVVLNGWIQKRRNLGGLIFCDVRDKYNICKISSQRPKMQLAIIQLSLISGKSRGFPGQNGENLKE